MRPATRRMLRLTAILAALCVGAAGCIGQTGEESMAAPTGAKLEVRSDAFAEGDEIPQKYTCDGADISPPLAWSGAPKETRAYAILVTDPDAQNFVHWVTTDIPSVVTSLDEGVSGTDGGGTEGSNSTGGMGWSGPCPPSGEHRYVFTVYALDGTLDLQPRADAATIRSSLQPHVLASGQLGARYARRRG